MELRVPEPPLEDEAIRLRLFGLEDAEAIVAACSDPEVPAWTGVPAPYSLQHAEAFLREATAPTRSTLHLAIVDAATGSLAGALTVWAVRPGVAEFGYWASRDFRGRGHMTRAVRLASGWLFSLGAARIQIATFPGNRSSERVAEKVGFQREGILRSYFDQRGERRWDVTMWSLLPGELV